MAATWHLTVVAIVYNISRHANISVAYVQRCLSQLAREANTLCFDTLPLHTSESQITYTQAVKGSERSGLLKMVKRFRYMVVLI